MAGKAIGPLCSYPTLLLCCPAFVFPLTLVSSPEHPSNDPLCSPKDPIGECAATGKQFLIHWEGVVFGGRHKAEVQVTQLEGALLQTLVKGGTGPGCSTNSKKNWCVTGPQGWAQAAPGTVAWEGHGTDPGCSGRWQTETHPKGRVILRLSQHFRGFREDGTCTRWHIDSCK